MAGRYTPCSMRDRESQSSRLLDLRHFPLIVIEPGLVSPFGTRLTFNQVHHSSFSFSEYKGIDTALHHTVNSQTNGAFTTTLESIHTYQPQFIHI